MKTLTDPRELGWYYIEDGKVYVKGSNYQGQLGLGDTDDRDSYQQVTALADEQVTGVWSIEGPTNYFATASGKLYAAGSETNSSLPVLMLTARAEDADQVLSFELGADNYVSKPFSPMVLAARVGAIFKRTALRLRMRNSLRLFLICTEET